MKSIKEKGEYRILCLGESTTMGQWPEPLEEILNQRNIGIKFSVIDKGVVGIQTGFIVDNLRYYIDRYAPHMVITMMGINDSIDTSFVVPYKPDKSYLISLRVYKLIRLLKLSISHKLKGISSTRDKKSEPDKIIKYPGLARENTGTNIKTSLDEQAYIDLKPAYRNRGNIDEAVIMYKENLKINPESVVGYIELGRYYENQRNFDEAEIMFNEAIKIDPENEEGYIELGRYYGNHLNFDKAETILKEALKINPGNINVYINLGGIYGNQGNFDKAEIMFKEALKIDPDNEEAYTDIGGYYRSQENFYKAETMFKEALRINPRNDIAIGALAILSKGQKKDADAEMYFTKANLVRLKYYNLLTHSNYNKLIKIVIDEGIKMVCVQYPMRRLEPLKNLLASHENIIFVDNEKAFKEAVGNESYNEYFRNIFGGDFGHCTDKGNILLAENIASVILEECFNKK